MAVIKHTENDAFAGAAVYRLRRDAQSSPTSIEVILRSLNQEAKRQLVFVRVTVAKAAIADPNLPDQDKSALVDSTPKPLARILRTAVEYGVARFSLQPERAKPNAICTD